MKRYADLLDDARHLVPETLPWDLQARLAAADPPLLVDVREPHEFAPVQLAGSLNVPRGLLEQACDWDHDVTQPLLAGGRAREIVMLCRSGHRSLLAAATLRAMGFERVASLRTGVRGWNDADLPLQNSDGQPVHADVAEVLLTARVRPDQRRPPAPPRTTTDPGWASSSS